MKYQLICVLLVTSLSIAPVQSKNNSNPRSNKTFSKQSLSVENKLNAFDHFGVGGDLSRFGYSVDVELNKIKGY
ncbi:hypothetical protein GCM10011365_08930 [Marinicella pacifica]|jgi:hypothetical protein|uniref:Uncharacterized protein n=1 Tax=Marinicella pacifica TaxID=1171543 RepID=A0A917FKX0_9GAMM|nr:hypothetical protein [Marinicella pacifica]GGF90017.1 hypothetical protein GCM10011365_08930 [Marinicella pacifica]